ncbi:hypothetical protein SERLADRAFT_408147 [Serpula lacrymans var. lacrymans S7.9]|nr:uncharacterized protein SERLADRAFT_408147 [Serpula lacrymans var. lacrymans S7.9]EGO25954.1 hypothetical protein SERLADRAFT_408147 [Serpula lacrymans var. lacrymans S7.9]
MPEDSWEGEPTSLRHTFQLGDPLGEVAKRLLTEGAPFPGDSLTNSEAYELGRILVYRVSESEHVITDSYRWLDDDITVLTTFLMDTKFCIADWYADQKGLLAGYPRDECEEYYSYLSMGDAIGDRVEEILNMGQPYSCDANLEAEETEGQFVCLPYLAVMEGREYYQVIDKELQFDLDVPAEFFCNKRLNLIHWYERQLEKSFQELNSRLRPESMEWEINHLRLLFNPKEGGHGVSIADTDKEGTTLIPTT